MRLYRVLLPLQFILLFSLVFPTVGKSQYKLMKEGEKLYDAENYNKSILKFNKAYEKSENPYADYNLGNALSKSGKHEEAIHKYNTVINSSVDDKIRAAAYYNMGNNYLAINKYQESIDAFKNALRLKPKDNDARNNYLYAKQLLQQQQQQQSQDQQDQDQDQNGDKEQQQQDQENNSEQTDQNDQNEEQGVNDNEADNQIDDTEQQAGQEMNVDKNKMNKLEAERLLEMIQKRDEEVQKQITQKKGGRSPSDKEW